MATITIDVPDELFAQLEPMRNRLPELLALSLQQPAVPAQIYRSLVEFIAQQPSLTDMALFHPDPAMRERMETLTIRSKTEMLTPAEQEELSEFERIEQLVILLKSGSLAYLTDPRD